MEARCEGVVRAQRSRNVREVWSFDNSVELNCPQVSCYEPEEMGSQWIPILRTVRLALRGLPKEAADPALVS
jgi:hypothetical protein